MTTTGHLLTRSTPSGDDLAHPNPNRPSPRLGLAGLRRLLVAGCITVDVAAILTGPFWMKLVAGGLLAVGWSLHRLKPEGTTTIGHALDLLAEAILNGVKKILTGVAIGIGIVLVLLALLSWAMTRVTDAAHQVEQQVTTSVTSKIPHPQIPDVGGWVNGVKDNVKAHVGVGGKP